MTTPPLDAAAALAAFTEHARRVAEAQVTLPTPEEITRILDYALEVTAQDFRAGPALARTALSTRLDHEAAQRGAHGPLRYALELIEKRLPPAAEAPALHAAVARARAFRTAMCALGGW